MDRPPPIYFIYLFIYYIESMVMKNKALFSVLTWTCTYPLFFCGQKQIFCISILIHSIQSADYSYKFCKYNQTKTHPRNLQKACSWDYLLLYVWIQSSKHWKSLKQNLQLMERWFLIFEQNLLFNNYIQTNIVVCSNGESGRHVNLDPCVIMWEVEGLFSLLTAHLFIY